jgi:N6-adenosine-specific RNA methylase IME4
MSSAAREGGADFLQSKPMPTYPYHPLANIFPLTEGKEFERLVASIKQNNGLHEPIWLYEEKILDGRNRDRACEAAGVAPQFRQYTGNDPVSFVIDANFHRRQLKETGVAMAAGRLATLPDGVRSDRQGASIEAPTQDEAADRFGIGRSSVQRARIVLSCASTALIEACSRDLIAVSIAAKLAEKHDKRFCDDVVAKVHEGTKPMEAFRLVRAARIAEDGIISPTGKYRVIYADPPWQYGNTQQPEFGEQRDHYATMTLEAICAEPVKDWAEDDAVLFLWCTSPMFGEVHQVWQAWGFEYKAGFVWDKIKHVMGHYNSVRHEHLLVCTRGSCQPDVRKLFDSVVTVEQGTVHSAKPAIFYDIIETLYPAGRRLEMYSRSKRRGWDQYGHRSEISDEAPPHP